MTSAVGFIVGFALFGAITYLPLYLQVTKGSSPTRSGLQLTPLMAGVLVTSIVSGQLISRLGRYRFFPIAGRRSWPSRCSCSRSSHAGTSTWVAAVFALVLGLGLGMVMQVLVLAVQNSVDPSTMGVATSGSTLFRQIGGSIGVALFGTIFANRVHVELAQRLPAGTHIPKTINPAGIRHLPPAAHAAFADAFAAALCIRCSSWPRVSRWSRSCSAGSCARCRSGTARSRCRCPGESRRCSTGPVVNASPRARDLVLVALDQRRDARRAAAHVTCPSRRAVDRRAGSSGLPLVRFAPS